MGTVFFRDQQGLLQGFNIAGDQPTPDEQGRINTVLSGQSLQPQQAPQQDQPGFGSAIKGGIGSLIASTEGGVARMGQGIAENNGGSFFGIPATDYEQYAEDKDKENEEYQKLIPDIFGSNESIGQRAAGLAGTAVSSAPPIIGGALGSVFGPLGTLAGAGIGAALMVPQQLQQNVQEQKQANEQAGNADKPIDWRKASAATAAQSVVEYASDLVPFHAAGFLTKDVLGKAVDGAVKTLAKTGVAASKTALAEGTEEAVQQAIQRWQAGENLDDKEALTSYMKNAIVGGIIGGGMGGAVGFAGARADAKSAKQMADADADAQIEAHQKAQMAATNVPANEARRAAPYEDEPPPPEAPVKPFGLLTDRSQEQTAVQTGLTGENVPAPDEANVGGIEKPETGPFAENEYTGAIDALRGEKLISPNRIQEHLAQNRPEGDKSNLRAKSNAIYQEMLKRNDAHPAGSLGQYAKIITPRGMSTKTGSNISGDVSGTTRDFIVKPVERADMEPYSLTVNGKKTKKKFQTQDQADSFAKTNNLSNYTVERDPNADQQYGVFSQHYRKLPGGAEQLVGSQVIETHPTIEEANEAVKKYDPAYSPATNLRRPVMTAEEKAARIKEDTAKELGPQTKALQSLLDKIVGPGKVAARVVPNMAGPTPNSIAEGSTVPVELSRIRNGVRQLVTVNSDLFNGDQNAIDQVGTHEVVHVLRNADLLSKKEWDDLYHTALNKNVPGKSYTFAQLGVARNRSMTSDPGRLMEEAIAEMLRYHFKDPTAFDKPVRGKIGKLVDFVRKIVGLTKRYNGDAVMQAILGGKVAARPEGFGGLGTRYVGSAAYSKVTVPPMYMKSDQFIQSVKQEKAKPEQWKAIFKNSGIKNEEIEWLGLNNWLDNQEGTVEKGDIADFIRANALKPQEVVLGGIAQQRFKVLHEKLIEAYRDDVNSNYQSFNDWLKDEENGNGLHSDDARELRSLADNYNGQPYHEYTTQPGGTNYTEWTFALPGLEPAFNVPGHFGGRKNILVSARTKERTFDGKKYLFIEEIQSDLHQHGRREGYTTPETMERSYQLDLAAEHLLEQRRVIKDQMNAIVDETGPAGGTVDFNEDQSARYQQAVNELDEINNNLDDIYNEQDNLPTGAPNAPLKTNWPEFAFKRLLRHAVESGYEGVAWHGEAESVAATEKYPSLQSGTDERGNKTYVVGGSQPVTGVMNLYLTRLPSFAKKYLKQWGVNLDHIQTKKATALSDYIGNIDDFHSLASAIGMDGDPTMLRPINRLVRVVEGQRNFDIDEAVSKAGVDPQPILDFIRAYEAENRSAGQTDQYGNPVFDRYQVQFNDDIKDSVLYEGQPIWSAVSTERMEQIKEDPNFQNWFGGSVVVQPNGDPKVMFHGTQSDIDFSRFKKLSHFGTLAAAGDRLSNVTYDRMADRWLKKNPMGEGPEGSFTSAPNFQRHLARIYGKWDDDKSLMDNLKISNDWWESLPSDEKMQLVFKHDPEVAEKMRIFPVFLSIKKPMMITDDGDDHSINDLIMMAEMEGAISPRESYVFRHSAGGGANFLAALKRKGYDGFIYRNTVEDPGSTSYIPFDAEQIKSVYNRGTWNKNDPRIDYSAVNLADQPKEFYSANAPMGQRVPTTPPQDRLAEVTAKVTYNNLSPVIQKLNKFLPDSMKYKFSQKVEDSFIAMQDRMLPWGKLIDRMKANGGFITNENDPYFRETLFAGQTDDRLQTAEKKFYAPLRKAIAALKITKADADEARKVNDAAREIMDQYGKKYQMGLSELYLYAQHAQERNREMRKRNENVVGFRPDQYEHGSGMSDVQAQEILKWFASKHFGDKFSSLADPNSIRSLFRKVIANTNDVRVAGQLNPEFRGTEFDNYQDYAPLRSWIDEHMDPDEDAVTFAKAGKGYNVRGNEDPHALGRQRLASNLVGNAFLQNEEAIIRAGKNEVGRSVLQLIRDNPELMDGYAESIEHRPTKWGFDKKAGVVRRVPDTSVRTDPNVLTVKEIDPENPNRVKETYIRFKDARLASALTMKSSLGNAGVGAMAKYLLTLNRYLGSLATSFNPEFMVSNFIRDLQVATLNLSEQEMKGLRMEVIKSVLPALGSIYKAQRTGQFTGEWAKTFEEFRKNGGMSAFMGIRDIDSTIERNSKALTVPDKNLLAYSKKAVHAVGDFIEDWNLAVENGTRLAAYKALRDRYLAMTDDPTSPKNIKRAQEQAAFAAKELTVNFNRGGTTRPLMNSLYLFYNASMQGSMALLNPMIRSKKARRMMGGLIVAGLMQDMIMSALSPEDDDGLKTYDKIPDYILEHNMVFMTPWTTRGYIKLPMPYLLNAFYNAGRITSKALRGGTSPGDALYSAMGTAIDSLNPFGSGGNAFLNAVAPTVLDPLIDIATNTDFTGKHIAPEESVTGGGDKASQRYWNNTDPMYVTISDWLSRLSGGQGKYIPGHLEYSPNVVEYWAHFIGGGAFTTAQRAAEFFTPGMKPEGNLYDILDGGDFAMNDVPMVRRFMGNVSERSNTELYFNKRDEVDAVLKEMKDAAKTGDRDRYMAVMQAYPDEYRAAVQIQNIEKMRKKITRRINQIRQSKLPDDQKTALIKTLKGQQDELIGKGNFMMRGIQ
jgi:hypothetical protein